MFLLNMAKVKVSARVGHTRPPARRQRGTTVETRDAHTIGYRLSRAQARGIDTVKPYALHGGGCRTPHRFTLRVFHLHCILHTVLVPHGFSR